MKRKWLFVFILLILLLFPSGTPSFAKNKQLIIVNKTTNELAFFNNGVLERKFKVATGKLDSYTPEGRFKVVIKLKNPPYYKYNIPGGHPNNPLGPRWIGINARGTNGHVYGIHGTNNPNSIGKYVSEGCVRMYNNEVMWLYDRVQIGAEVIIIKSPNSFERMAVYFGYPLKQPPKPAPKPEPEPIPVKVFINGEELAADKKQTSYLTENSRTMAPMRAIFEKLGAEITWDDKLKKVTAEKGKTVVEITIGSNKAYIDGKEVALDQKAEIKNGYTFIPVRFVSEVFGGDIQWDSKARAVYITVKPEEPEVIEIKEKLLIDEETKLAIYVDKLQIYYVEAKSLLNAIGAEDISIDSAAISFVYEEKSVHFDFKENVLTIDGQTIVHEYVPKIVDETVYLPIILAEKMLGRTLQIVE